MESLARILLPILRDYLESDEGRKDYEEWKLQKEILQDMDKSATDMEQWSGKQMLAADGFSSAASICVKHSTFFNLTMFTMEAFHSRIDRR